MSTSSHLRITQHEIETLKTILRNSGWLTATQIGNLAADCHGIAWSDRKIRAIASESNGSVISGQQGYKLTVDATGDEARHAVNWLRHQANEMMNRALSIEFLNAQKG